jgi:SAM-dependent methyltransferase
MELVLAGRKLQQCRTEFLQETGRAKSVLILGEGNGRFLCQFLKNNLDAEVVSVDSSATMLELTRQRIIRNGLGLQRIRFIQADVLGPSNSDWDCGPFDLVVTHFFLDCFRADQLERLIPAIANRTSPDATWLLADFQVPERGMAKGRAAAILWLAYCFFRIATGLSARRLTVPDPFLTAHGFRLRERRLRECGLLHSDLWSRGNR